MCRECEFTGRNGPTPYLAGMAVMFTWPYEDLEQDPNNTTAYPKWVRVEHTEGPFIGICVGHHAGWVRVRTRGQEFRFKPDMQDEHLLAYWPASEDTTVAILRKVPHGNRRNS